VWTTKSGTKAGSRLSPEAPGTRHRAVRRSRQPRHRIKTGKIRLTQELQIGFVQQANL